MKKLGLAVALALGFVGMVQAADLPILEGLTGEEATQMKSEEMATIKGSDNTLLTFGYTSDSFVWGEGTYSDTESINAGMSHGTGGSSAGGGCTANNGDCSYGGSSNSGGDATSDNWQNSGGNASTTDSNYCYGYGCGCGVSVCGSDNESTTANSGSTWSNSNSSSGAGAGGGCEHIGADGSCGMSSGSNYSTQAHSEAVQVNNQEAVNGNYMTSHDKYEFGGSYLYQ